MAETTNASRGIAAFDPARSYWFRNSLGIDEKEVRENLREVGVTDPEMDGYLFRRIEIDLDMRSDAGVEGFRGFVVVRNESPDVRHAGSTQLEAQLRQTDRGAEASDIRPFVARLI